MATLFRALQKRHRSVPSLPVRAVTIHVHESPPSAEELAGAWPSRGFAIILPRAGPLFAVPCFSFHFRGSACVQDTFLVPALCKPVTQVIVDRNGRVSQVDRDFVRVRPIARAFVLTWRPSVAFVSASASPVSAVFVCKCECRNGGCLATAKEVSRL